MVYSSTTLVVVVSVVKEPSSLFKGRLFSIPPALAVNILNLKVPLSDTESILTLSGFVAYF